MLVAAIWHNVAFPVDVTGDQPAFVGPLDVLVLINEINAPKFTKPGDSRLPRQLASAQNGPFLDVNCDGFISPLDPLVVINYINAFGSGPGGRNASSGGTFANASCSPQLLEGTGFTTELSRILTVPTVNKILKVQFESPSFDTLSQLQIRDAFEIEITDSAGRPVVLAYSDQSDASFNWSEGSTPIVGLGTWSAANTPGLEPSVSFDLSELATGTEIHVLARLVNNDSDTNTSVIIRGYEFVDVPVGTPGSATATSFAATAAHNAPIELQRLSDLEGNVVADYGRTSLSGDKNQLLTELKLTNIGTQTVLAPLIAVLDNFSELESNAMRPDGILPDGRPFFDLTPQLVDQTLKSGESIRSREIRFLNDSGNRFTYRLKVYGKLNSAPSRFTSEPIVSIEAGKAYRYQAEAKDGDEDRISYSVIVGPDAMKVDSRTGLVTWNTLSSDIGTHRITVRATDPHGLSLEQTFDLQVVASLQNRPPNFVTDPVTDAIASSGFEITTIATGPKPAGVDVINGFRGPRLVAINAGDQTVSVHAGQNNDRFDDTTVYSTGEPRPTGRAIDVGYSVDVGLPPFLVPNDSNDVLGMDQGDFNGDGILDLVVLTKRIETTKPQGQRDTIEITRMLGDGNGNFSAPLVIATIPFVSNAQARHLRVADIDGDGRLDVIAIEETSSRLITVRGLGNGEFEPAVLTTLATSLNDYRLVDLDGDGQLDIVGRNANVTDFGWMRGRGDGTFEPFVRLANGGGISVGASNYSNRSYDFADLNGDGHLDIVLGEHNSGNVVVLLNDGGQNFSIALTIDPPGGNAGPIVVHVADFTGDGELDIFTVNSWRSRVDLFVGDGSGTNFTHQPRTDLLNFAGNAAGSDGPVDINGDGHLDIVLTNAGSSDPTSPQVLINDGLGNFTRTDYPMLSFTGHSSENNQTNLDIARGAMFGDYNGDGIMDLIYMTDGSDFNGVGIRLGTRPGEFGATRTIQDMTLNGNDTEIHAADFNGDGNIDLLSLSNARMSLGNGDGTFQPSFPATGIAGGFDNGVVADFNLDGIPDYVAARAAGSSDTRKFYVALGNGDGTFDATLGPVSPSQFFQYSDIRTADFNNDGYPDIIAKAGVERFIDVYLNDPANPGTFSQSFRTVIQITGVNTRGFTSSFATGDFDGDGKIDFVAVDQAPGEPLKLVLFSGDGFGNFSVIKETLAFDDAMFPDPFYYPGVLQSGDVNGDGILDIVSFGWQGAIVHIGNGDGTFTSIDHYPRESINSEAVDGYLIDFDEDSHLDLVQYGRQETLTIRRGFGDGTFAEPERVGMIGAGDALTFADIDNDGHLDIAMVMTFANNYNNEDVVFYYGTRNGLVDQLAVDLDGDGNEEILAINEANDRLKIFVGNNLDGLNRRADLLTGRAPHAVATGDLNSDGNLEIITANRAGRSISVFSGSLASGYTSTEIYVGSAPIDVLTRDINGDGHTDVLVLDEVAQAIWVLSGSANGTLSAPVAIALGDKPGKFTIADATGDGRLDAVITLPDSNRLMILSGIGFQPVAAPIYVSLSDSPSDVQVTDLNADGNPDLATTLPNSNVLSVLYGRGNNQFARAQKISVGSKPTRVTLADADEDGRMDLIVANSGDNTASVIYNRFDPNEVYRYDSEAIDPDNDPIVYSIVDGPGGLIINSQTGALLWAASPDQVGEHTVTLAANDGRGGIATQSFKIDVQPARDNALPLIATEPNTRIGAGETFTYQATALDNDRDTLRYSLIDAPPGATIDPTTGKVAWDARADLALSFAPHGINSTGRVEIEAHPSLRPASLTAEGWYNFTGLPASNGRSNLIYQAGSGNQTAYALWNFGNAFLRLELDYPAPTNRFTYSIPFVPTANRWTHFAITIDDSTRIAKIFVDGVERGSVTIPGAIVYNPAVNAQVGDSSVFFTRAIIDNYRLWNVVRTPAEIAEGLSRQYNGDSRVVLDYRFDEPQTLTVRDFSPAGNHGYRKANGLLPVFVPGLAETGSHQFTIGVEDGRGGSDQQSFTLDIVPELRGMIRGQAFNDLDNNGVRNGSEPALSGRHLFIDTNGNGFPDPIELQTTTDASGNYQFKGLLPGQYPLKVSPVAGFETPLLTPVSVTANVNTQIDLAIEQLALSQIRGQLRTEDADAIAYWKVYADLDLDNERDENEPMTMSDRDGNFAITGLSVGNYTIRTELPAGWAVASGNNGQNVTLAANAISEGNHFTLEPTNTSVTGGLHFVTTPTFTIEARQTFRYASVASGIHNKSITYDLSLAPDGMSIDPATGLMAWQPAIAQVGEHLVIVRATNASGSISLHDFTLTVTAPNTPPILLTELPSTGYVGLVYAVNLSAQDAESQTITYNLLSGPSSATLNASTGELRWIPTLTDVGNVTFSIELRDILGGITVVNETVVVINSQPLAIPFSVTTPRTRIGLGQDYLARAQGSDALGRPLTWSLVTGPTGLLVSPNGTLRWTPGNDDLGSHSIVLEATNVDGGTQNSAFTLQVAGRPVNNAPNVTSTPITSTVIGKVYQYDVEVLDNDADPLSFALLDAPVGMSIHPTLGTIRWTPAADQLGESNVSVQVTDPDGSTATQDFKVKVSRSGGPPSIRSVPPTEAAIGIGYLYSIVARDAEGDPLTYRLLASPVGMTIARTTGVISWTPAVDQLGQQDIVIEVSDGIGGAVTQAFAIRVSAGAPNLPPVISSDAPRFGVVGQTYRYTVVATDPEGTDIRYSLGQAPVEMTIDPLTGLVEWTPAMNYVGKSVVTFIATDAGGATAVESFELDVLAANSQPTIASTVPIDVSAGALFTYQVLGRDIDLDQLTYTLTTAPAGATIDPFGRITWPTTVALIGAHNFAVRVADPRGGVATQSFTLSVIEDVIPPKVSLIESLGDANRKILPWQGPFVVYARAIDNVAVASLTLTANGQDIPLSAAGTAVFTFEEWAFREINATATATDTNGNVTTKTISFDYDFPEGWSGAGTEDIPTVAITSPTDTAAVFGMVTITGTASHADFAGYKLSYRRIDELTFTQFFESTTAVLNGQLGVWDTSLLINDEYVIRLEAASNAGVVNVVEHNVGLSGELKLGNFQLSFTDMVIPVAGIPIEITRIYDTLQADREGDFGYGWRLEYRNTDLRVGLPKSGLEDIGIYSPLRQGVKVYLNVPGVGRQGFTFNPDIRVLPGFGGNNLVLGRPRFTPDRGVTSTLGTGTSSYLQVNERGELFAPGGIPYNPASPDFGGAYVLRTREGIEYRIDGATGRLNSANDRQGNRVEFTNTEIKSSTGISIAFVRDSRNRVRSIVDPDGGTLSYEYSNGDLSKAIDRIGTVMEFRYIDSPSHYLESVIDPLGRPVLRNAYDRFGRLVDQINPVQESSISVDTISEPGLVKFTYANGVEENVRYDSVGRVIERIDALGRSVRTEYGPNGISRIVDQAGAVTRYERNSLGLPTKEIKADGSSILRTYDAQGNALTVSNELGVITRNEYDERGNLLSTTIGEASFHYSYDRQGSLVRVVDAEGRIIETRRNGQGYVVETVGPDGHVTRHERNNLGLETAQNTSILETGEVARDISLRMQYDRNGNTTGITDAQGGRVNQGYDALGNLERITDQTGRVLEYDHNGTGLVHQVRFANGTTASFGYDSRNQLTQGIDRDGNITKFAYNAVGDLVTRILPNDTPDTDSDNPRIEYEFDAVSRITKTSDPTGAFVTQRYDILGRLVERAASNGETVKIEYDAAGRVIRETDATSQSTRYLLDNRGNRLETIYSDGTRTRNSFDLLGRLKSTTNALGETYFFDFDEAGNLSRVVDPLGFATKLQRDNFGNVRQRVDALGNVHRSSYSDLSQLIQSVSPGGLSAERRYRLDGKLSEERNANGQTTSYFYDTSGNLRETRFADGSSTNFRFGPSGNLSEITTQAGVTSQKLDKDGNLKEWNGPDGTRVEYEYDSVGRVTGVSLDGHRTSYVYENNRLVQILRNSEIVSERVYDIAGNVITETFANGVVEHRSFDSQSRLLRITLRDASNTIIQDLEFAYDLAGRMVQEKTHLGATREYAYDSLGQIVRYSSRESETIHELHEYRYDANGNMIWANKNGSITQWQFDANGRRIHETRDGSSMSYAFDADGNLLSGMKDGIQQFAYQWDARGRLVRVDTIENGNTATIQYEYDWAGLMTRRIENGVATDFVYDRSDKLPRLLRSTSRGSHEYYTHAERVLTRTASAVHSFYHSDASGNIRLQSSANAMLHSRLDYMPFGELSSTSHDTNGEGQVAFQFAGEPFDPASKLTYLRQRHYKPSNAQFVSRDPLQGFETLPLSQQPYQYGYNTPLTRNDPSGERIVPTLAELQVAGGIAAMISAVSAIQVLAGSGGLSGNSIDFSGPFQSFGIGASFGVGFSVDLYSGLLGSSKSFVGGPESEGGYRLSGGAGVSFGIGLGVSANFGSNVGSVKLNLRINPVTRYLGGSALTGALIIGDVSWQVLVGQSPWAAMTLGFAKGLQNNGGSFGLAAGIAANYKTGVYIAGSVAVDKSDAEFIRGLGDNIGNDRWATAIDEAYARYF